jgi:hypothetical protein
MMAHKLAEKLPFNLPTLSLSSGSIEAMKWLALIAMTLDHANKILFQAQFAWMYNLGRLAMPLFGFVLAYNLARCDALESHIYHRVIMRMFIIGLVATPFYSLAFHHCGLGSLNIMFTLGLATCIMYLIDKSIHNHNADSIIVTRALAVALFVLGSLFVEGHYVAVGYVLVVWAYCKTQKIWTLLIWILTTASLVLINGNHWAFAAIPIVFIVSKIHFKLPRLKWVFYVYYPLHLAILIGIQRCCDVV